MTPENDLNDAFGFSRGLFLNLIGRQGSTRCPQKVKCGQEVRAVLSDLL